MTLSCSSLEQNKYHEKFQSQVASLQVNLTRIIQN